MNRKRNGIGRKEKKRKEKQEQIRTNTNTKTERKEKKRKYIDFIGQRRFAVKGQKKGRQRKILFFEAHFFCCVFFF